MSCRVEAESGDRREEERRRAAKALALGLILGGFLVAASGESPAPR